MDKEILVNALLDLIKRYANRGRTFSLVMMVPTEPNAIESNYSLLISAKWLDNKNPKEAINEIVKSIIKQAGSTNSPVYRKLARISLINTSDPFINAITSAFNVTQSVSEILNCNINGVQIERAILLESHHPRASKKA